MNEEKYLFRRQFLLGPRYINKIEGWQKVKFTDSYCLSVHPELEISAASSSYGEIYILGYILDPDNPGLGNKEIAENIVRGVKHADELFDRMKVTCGRHVVIVRIRDDIRIFSDTAGLRQVFHYKDPNGLIWCASQPALIAEQCDLDVEDSIREDFQNTRMFSANLDYWYPGTSTLYCNLRHLNPNHYLDLSTGVVKRFWPTQKIRKLKKTECVKRAAAILTGIFESASNRFEMALGVTSGLDSRILLAASKDTNANIDYFTHKHQRLSENDPDISVPGDLLEHMGLEHHIVSDRPQMDDEFEKIFRRNVTSARPVKGVNAFSIYKHYMEKEGVMNRIVVYGNLGEISRRDRHRFPKMLKSMITADSLTVMAIMYGSDIARAEFAQWLSSARNLTRFGVHILDLFHWEQRVGNWAAMTFSEYDLAFETLCPYNCREYLETMLGTPFRHRTRPSYRLHRALISELWSQALDYPVSPSTRKIKTSVHDILYSTNLYDILKYVYLMNYLKYLQRSP